MTHLVEPAGPIPQRENQRHISGEDMFSGRSEYSL